MMKNCYLSREQYEEISREASYPIRTADAAAELRFRGIDIGYIQLRHLGQKGTYNPETKGIAGSDHKWSAELIDQVAEDLAAKKQLTREATAADVLQIDYFAFLQGRRDTRQRLTVNRQFRMTPRDAEMLENAAQKWGCKAAHVVRELIRQYLC
jgi:hypothetical protein